MSNHSLTLLFICLWYLAGLWAGWKTWQAARRDGIKTKTSLWIAIITSFFGVAALVATHYIYQQPRRRP